jgi:hypothetical protein
MKSKIQNPKLPTTNYQPPTPLPCPFCGSPAETWHTNGTDYIGCRNKQCVKPKVGSTEIHCAIARWNNRPDPREFTMGTCGVCGCTDDRACEGGCHWVNEDHTLCIQCSDALGGLI